MGILCNLIRMSQVVSEYHELAFCLAAFISFVCFDWPIHVYDHLRLLSVLSPVHMLATCRKKNGWRNCLHIYVTSAKVMAVAEVTGFDASF